MNKKYYLILGVLFGLSIFFFIPIFPVSFPNISGTEHTTTFFSGLKTLKMGFGLKSVLILEMMGGLVGFLFPFLIIKE